MKKMIAVAALFLLAAFGARAQADTTLTLSSYAPYSFWLVSETLEGYADAVEEATDGRVKVRVLKTALGEGAAHYDLARDGVADITLGVPGYTPGRFLLTDVGSLPFAGNTSVVRSVALWRTFENFAAMQEEFKDVHVISLFATPGRNFWNTVRPIETVADFEGLKFRASGGLESDVATALGMTPLVQPVSKIYELLSNRVVDAVAFPSETIQSFNLTKVVKYGTRIPGGFTATPLMLVMNKGRYESLAEEDRAAIDSLGGEAFAHLQGEGWDTRDIEGEAAFIADGGQMAEGSDELLSAMREKAGPVVDSWAEAAAQQRNTDVQAIVDYYLEQVDSLK